MISLTQTFFDGIRIIMIVNPRGLYVLFILMLISINIIKYCNCDFNEKESFKKKRKVLFCNFK